MGLDAQLGLETSIVYTRVHILLDINFEVCLQFKNISHLIVSSGSDVIHTKLRRSRPHFIKAALRVGML